MLGSRLGTALSVSLFSPVPLVLEVKILLLVTAELPSLAVAVVVSLQPSNLASAGLMHSAVWLLESR